MRILLVADAARLRPWIRDFAADLTAQRFDVRLRLVTGDVPSRLLRLVIELDRLLTRPTATPAFDQVQAADIAVPADDQFAPDAIVDLTADPSEPGTGVPAFALAFDGAPGEDALFAALTRRGGATLEVYEPQNGSIVERARPSLESASGVVEAASSIGARAGTLLLARLVALRDGRIRQRETGRQLGRVEPGGPSLKGTASALARSLARHVYHLVCQTAHWRIGWRFLDGPGLAESGTFAGPPFRSVRDPGLHWYADPFILEWQGQTHVLVEDFDTGRGQACISALQFGDDGPTGDVRPVLQEPWHLSFPFPIVHDGVLYMVPESTARREVTLYRCIAFPDRWEPVATLLSNVCASDTSIIQRGERWWMFSTIEDGRGGWSDMLAIHSAPTLFGPWTPHRDIPLLVDVGAARPAGRPWMREGRLFRSVQDCTSIYGGGIDIVEVTRLDDEGYEQIVRAKLRSGPAWPGRRLHTLDRVGRLEVIDGVVPHAHWQVINDLIRPSFEPARLS